MKVIATPNAPAAIGPYVQGRVSGNLLFASGQIALDPATGELVGTTIEEQTAQVMKNVAAILAEAGTDFDHVLKATCFLDDIDDFAAFNAEYAKSFGDARPARSAVGVAKLPKGALVEVEVIAEVYGALLAASGTVRGANGVRARDCLQPWRARRTLPYHVRDEKPDQAARL